MSLVGNGITRQECNGFLLLLKDERIGLNNIYFSAILPNIGLLLTVLLIGILLLIFEFSDIDIAIQDRIYDLGTRAWPITKADHALRLIFYDGPKIALIAFGGGIFIASLWSFPNGRLARYRRHLAFMLVTLALVPSMASLGKSITNVYCPSKLQRYGGTVPYVRLFDHYPDDFVQEKLGRCYPAGHASGGFALIALFFVLNRRAWRVAGLTFGLGLGWLMGGYQMLIGVHFFSHTVTTMLLAWIICTLVELVMLRKFVQ